MWVVAVACTVLFTTPGVGDSCGRQPAISDWRPSTIELRAWAIDDRTDSTVLVRNPARVMGERDTIIFERTDAPWTVCVELVRWQGIRPCERRCLAVGDWPVGVKPPAPMPPGAFNPRVTLTVKPPLIAREGWKLYDLNGRAVQVAICPGYYWEKREGERTQRYLVDPRR